MAKHREGSSIAIKLIGMLLLYLDLNTQYILTERECVRRPDKSLETSWPTVTDSESHAGSKLLDECALYSKVKNTACTSKYRYTHGIT